MGVGVGLGGGGGRGDSWFKRACSLAQIEITGPCRTSEEARAKFAAWLEEQERAGVSIESHKLSAMVGRAEWGSFWAYYYDPDAKPPEPGNISRRGPDDPLPLP